MDLPALGSPLVLARRRPRLVVAVLAVLGIVAAAVAGTATLRTTGHRAAASPHERAAAPRATPTPSRSAAAPAAPVTPAPAAVTSPPPTGSTAGPTPWLVVALGDSVVSGGPCDCWTFPGRFASLIRSRTRHRVTVRNLGVGGTTSADLLASLRAGGRTAQNLRGAQAVTVTIGANDMVTPRSEWARDSCRGCFDRTADRVQSNVVRIVRRVRAAVGSPNVEIMVTTYWNVFQEPPTADAADGRHSEYDVMARRATLLTNSALCAAAHQGGVTCVDLFRPFKGDGTRDARRLLEPDRDHPNWAGHQLIAETLATRSELARTTPADSAA